MPKYRLTYFGGCGRAELARLVFALAGVDYEDKRIKFEEWAALKPNTPFGFLPTLEIEGGPTLTESLVIASYIAEEHGVGGKDALQQAQVRMIITHINDLYSLVVEHHFETDEAKKENMKKVLAEKTEITFGNLEKQLKANKEGRGFFVGDAATAADLMFFYVAGDKINLLGHMGEKAKNVPLLKALVARVGELPNIAEWLKKRPESSF